MVERVSLLGVAYSYERGNTLAVSDVDLKVDEGEIVSIVGPSGCGKSTLLALIAGLLVAEKGEIDVRVETGHHPLAMMFQVNTVLPWKSVIDNVALHWRFSGLSARSSRLRAGPLLEMASLTEFARAYPAQLSGGMNRRVQFLSAMAASPSILLLDEPFSALDEPTRVQLHQDIHPILRDAGTTTILVTHDIAEAISLSDRIVVLTARPGRILMEYCIPLGKTRDMFALRQDSMFLDIYAKLWRTLNDTSRPARPEADSGEAFPDEEV
jgi:NitT/TauT family transport system ATP-binding protein